MPLPNTTEDGTGICWSPRVSGCSKQKTWESLGSRTQVLRNIKYLFTLANCFHRMDIDFISKVIRSYTERAATRRLMIA